MICVMRRLKRDFVRESNDCKKLFDCEAPPDGDSKNRRIGRGAWVRYVEIGTTGINILLFLMGLLFASLLSVVAVVAIAHSSASSIKSIKRFLIVNNTDDLILRARWLDATRLGLTIGFPSSTRFSRLPAETSNKQTTRWARRVPGTNPQAAQRWVYTAARYSILIWRGWINNNKNFVHFSFI